MQLLKKYILLFAIFIFAACSGNSKIYLRAAENIKGTAAFGDSIKTGTFFDAENMQTVLLKEKDMVMRIKGTVEDVCSKNGCWMIIKLADGKAIWVTFKDHKFFIPKSTIGKLVVANGVAYDNPDLKQQRFHYTGDDIKGETTAAGNALPTGNGIVFEASGVVVL